MSKSQLWNGTYKIPWNDPDFSRRMLAEHLNQEHDLASRKFATIDLHVAWLHEKLLDGKKSSILDLGCGPGFYSNRLAALGHQVVGIDFSPASITYANEHRDPQTSCIFRLEDLRKANFDKGFDLAMMLYGEMNVFSPEEMTFLVGNIRHSLNGRGAKLLFEIQRPEIIEAVGRREAMEFQVDSGLFSDNPHRYRVESRWVEEEETAIETFIVKTETGSSPVVYRSTTKAWSRENLQRLLEQAGFSAITEYPDWPASTETFFLIGAEAV